MWRLLLRSLPLWLWWRRARQPNPLHLLRLQLQHQRLLAVLLPLAKERSSSKDIW